MKSSLVKYSHLHSCYTVNQSLFHSSFTSSFCIHLQIQEREKERIMDKPDRTCFFSIFYIDNQDHRATVTYFLWVYLQVSASVNCKFCQGTKITDPQILSYPKVVSKFNRISALHFPHALGKKKIAPKNPQKNHTSSRPTRAPPNQTVLSQNQKSTGPGTGRYLISLYCTGLTKFPFTFTKHKTSDHVSKRCLLLFSCNEDFGTAMKAERKHFPYGFFSYSDHSSPALLPLHQTTVLA